MLSTGRGRHLEKLYIHGGALHGPAHERASSVANDGPDGVIVKVDTATGPPLWAIGMGSNVDATRALGVAVDSEDHAVLTGEGHGGHDGDHQLVLGTRRTQSGVAVFLRFRFGRRACTCTRNAHHNGHDRQLSGAAYGSRSSCSPAISNGRE